MNDRGLDDDGYIVREGSLDRISATFRPVVDSLIGLVTERFPSLRLHSAYLYGSIPRGTATAGVSDLDVLLALRDEPDDRDRENATMIEAALDTNIHKSTAPASCCPAQNATQ